MAQAYVLTSHCCHRAAAGSTPIDQRDFVEKRYVPSRFHQAATVVARGVGRRLRSMREILDEPFRRRRDQLLQRGRFQAASGNLVDRGTSFQLP
jgi:hypothetical protein